MNPNNQNAGKVPAWELEKIVDLVKDVNLIPVDKMRRRIRANALAALKAKGLGPNSDEAGLVFSRLKDILQMEI
jgi:hypothetical protein